MEQLLTSTTEHQVLTAHAEQLIEVQRRLRGCTSAAPQHVDALQSLMSTVHNALRVIAPSSGQTASAVGPRWTELGFAPQVTRQEEATTGEGGSSKEGSSSKDDRKKDCDNRGAEPEICPDSCL